jgi:hypothetical protein
MLTTARARYSVRLFLSVLAIAVALSAVFGYFQGLAAGSDGVSGVLRGAISGGLISGAIVLLEIFILSGSRGTLLRHTPFLVLLSVRSLVYLAVIWSGLAVGAWLVPATAPGSILFGR